MRNRLHALLLQLDPHYQEAYGPLKSKTTLLKLQELSLRSSHVVTTERISLVRRLAGRLLALDAEGQELAARIRQLASERFTPLTRLCGVSLLTAGRMVLDAGLSPTPNSPLMPVWLPWKPHQPA